MTGRQETLGVVGLGMRGGHLSGNSIPVFCPRQPPTKPGLKGKHCSALYRTVGAIIPQTVWLHSWRTCEIDVLIVHLFVYHVCSDNRAHTMSVHSLESVIEIT